MVGYYIVMSSWDTMTDAKVVCLLVRILTIGSFRGGFHTEANLMQQLQLLGRNKPMKFLTTLDISLFLFSGVVSHNACGLQKTVKLSFF